MERVGLGGRSEQTKKISNEASIDVPLAHPHVPLIAAGCTQAIRLVSGMAAFGRDEIGNFKFEEITRRINKIYPGFQMNFKTAALIRARFRLLLPSQSSPFQNEVTLLYLKVELTHFSTIRETISYTQV
jgi:hypothetical protein